ncbi:MAG: transglycosylase SLT domain-containing protein [Bacteroidales bacterium]|nr:transglycosylase SLT domain-containing protein [Bacteroidales bacterium]MBQ4169873.1 transglycosylase SLT domain-containing protein [Bacteroidales bacterium]MBR4000820.1 transglycosylase SLT domain-containing protein [Bacteroidales bacterium]
MKRLLLLLSILAICLPSRAQEIVPGDVMPDPTDSLLSVWYISTRLKSYLPEEIPDSARFTSNVPDSVLVQRLEKMNSFISLPFNETVKNYMILYSEKSREKMEHILGVSNYYMPIFEEILDRYGLPLELKYMAIIESAMNPLARSRAGATGMWQFMYNTAKSYNLKITSYVDERLDIEKAADAAARYLQDAYNTFGDWALAICSYNCGSGNVNKAIQRSGKRDFWSIYPYLPRETRGYVPAFVGAMYAMTYYKEYGLVPEPVALPHYTDTIMVNKNLHFKQINELTGIPVETLRELNPQYTHDIVPGNEGPYVLKIPYQYTNSFISVEDSVYTHKADSLLSAKVLTSVSSGGDGGSIRYLIKNGDTLGSIARRYHVTVSNLKRWNNLKSDSIRAGRYLTIYQ